MAFLSGSESRDENSRAGGDAQQLTPALGVFAADFRDQPVHVFLADVRIFDRSVIHRWRFLSLTAWAILNAWANP
jgi:hypothetical protein